MARSPQQVQQTPLEQLTEMNERVGKTRKRSAKPRDPTKKVERFYRAQLKSLVRSISKAVEEEVIPVVKEEKSAYRADAAPEYTADGYADRIIAVIRALSQRFVQGEFAEQYERLARRTVSMAEAESTDAFVKSVNQAVGVDMRPILDQEGMQEYIQAASWQNAELIKSVPEEYLKRIETAVVGGVRGGDAPTKIARNIREATGVTQRRAELLARDQTSKLTSEITERRQKQAGIKYFQWITSKDERVGDDHRRAARRDVGYGPGIYRWDKPPREGVPGNSTRPNCRCTAKPIFEFELPDKGKK